MGSVYVLLCSIVIMLQGVTIASVVMFVVLVTQVMKREMKRQSMPGFHMTTSSRSNWEMSPEMTVANPVGILCCWPVWLQQRMRCALLLLLGLAAAAAAAVVVVVMVVLLLLPGAKEGQMQITAATQMAAGVWQGR
jgi:hypothetical protein